MLPCHQFYDTILSAGISLFTGVPDSLLKEICAYISDATSENQHIITANEGAAVALASGHYLATGSPALVYLQNSGLGNCINPLVSLADRKVYSIPMLLMVGWRGEPGKPDEPQHMKQGEITAELLQALGIPYEILPKEIALAEGVVKKLLHQAGKELRPVALLVQKNTFAPHEYSTEGKKAQHSEKHLKLTREHAIKILLDRLGPEALVVASTGMISREVYEARDQKKQNHDQDFLTVGSMGHCSQIAYGIANARPDKVVYCLDGDGAALMHMGSMTISGQYNRSNLIHVVLNNGRHDSVGGQPTVAFDVSLTKIARACGYSPAIVATTEEQVISAMENLSSEQKPTFIEIQCLSGARNDLGRPKTTPSESKKAFMKHIKNV